MSQSSKFANHDWYLAQFGVKPASVLILLTKSIPVFKLQYNLCNSTFNIWPNIACKQQDNNLLIYSDYSQISPGSQHSICCRHSANVPLADQSIDEIYSTTHHKVATLTQLLLRLDAYAYIIDTKLPTAKLGYYYPLDGCHESNSLHAYIGNKMCALARVYATLDTTSTTVQPHFTISRQVLLGLMGGHCISTFHHIRDAANLLHDIRLRNR
ncbi:hypothetical protein EDC01DRAFT_635278 [Geopyxis carbonaria]|nr:hypothetical protein EDC01DRAFT_635278 [Geopyxis carbonaria]